MPVQPPAPPARRPFRATAARVARRLALAAVAITFACAGRQQAPVGGQTSVTPPRLALEPCTLPRVEGSARCGTFLVPEDRDRPDGRRIPLRVVVLSATGARRAADPVVVITGGPGQGAAELAAGIADGLAELRERRDLVLVDQRGTGASNRLTCPDGLAVLADSTGAALRACLAELSTRADVRQYTSEPAVEDLEAVRAALGTPRVNLFGISYGTRMAQLYARRHPERVRTVMLRAVAPLGFDIPRDGARAAGVAMQRVVDDCAADAACAAAYPRLAAELDTVIARATTAPARVRAKLPDRADSVEVVIDRALLGQAFYVMMLGTASRQALPAVIHGAATGGLARLAPVAAQVHVAVYGAIPIGMYLSVVCTEDVAAWTPAERARPAASLFDGMVDFARVCAAWPRGVGAPVREPAPWNGPALLLSGTVDPATPPASGEVLARLWPRARHVVLPATAHGPTLPGCAGALAVRFLDAADAAALDTSCVAAMTLPPFVVPHAR